MTKERIAKLRNICSGYPWVSVRDVTKECLDEIERLDNITLIQQKQIERLLAARDIEKLRADRLAEKLSPAATDLAAHPRAEGQRAVENGGGGLTIARTQP